MNYDEIKVWDGYNCSFCEHKHPLKPECKEKKFCALEIDRAYKKGGTDAIDGILSYIEEISTGLVSVDVLVGVCLVKNKLEKVKEQNKL